MSTKIKTSSIDNLTKVTAVSGSLASPQATLSGYWKLDQTLTGSITGLAGTASKWASDVIMNGQTVNGSTTPITIPLNTTTTSSTGDAGYITFVKNNSSVNQTTYVSAALTYNPNTGNLATTGTIGASNFASTASIGASASIAASTSVSGTHSGNSSGTNTGDQTLSGLGGAALTGATFIGDLITTTTLGHQAQKPSDATQYTYYTWNGVAQSGATGWGVSTGGGTGTLTMDTSGNVTVNGNVTAYSDITLKDNIEIIPNALNKVARTRGVTYTRTDLEDKLKRHTGVIAQEIESVLPEAVMTDGAGIKSVAYGNVIGLLIEAIKELDDKVNSLQKQLDEKNNDTTTN
jgi:hypothetical protein